MIEGASGTRVRVGASPSGAVGPDSELPADPDTHAPGTRGSRDRRRLIGGVLVAAGIAILVSAAWVGWRTYQAYSHLTAASAAVSELQGQLQDPGDLAPDAAAATLESLQSESAAAAAAVDDPLYRFATVLPSVGPNLDAIGHIAATVDSLATDVLPAIVEVAQTVQPSALAPRGGSIDLTPIAQASGTLQRADAAVEHSRTSIAALDRAGLVTPVFDAVESLSSKLDSAGSVVAAAARAARLLPPMLGADGPRHYLVVFQNLAEPRATGGIFGSYALMSVADGTITMVEAAPSRTLGRFDPASAGLSPEQLALYTAEMATYPQDVNFTPDFSVAATLFAGMYETRTGTAVDGVVAIDPVALSYTLKGTGPVNVGEDVVLTSETVVPLLLSTAYRDFDDGASQKRRDEFMAKATTAAFGAVMSGRGDPATVMSGLRRAAAERRVLVWSAHDAEQVDLASTQLAGVLSDEVGTPSIGVFLNDGTGAKLGYYLRNEVRVVAGDCRTDGGRELRVTVTLNYDAPSSGLPDYVTGIGVGGHADGVAPYDLQTNVLVFAPAGGSLVPEVRRDGAPTSLQIGSDRWRSVGATTVTLSPGQSAELEFTMTGPALSDGTSIVPRLELTPGVAAWKSEAGEYRGCAS